MVFEIAVVVASCAILDSPKKARFALRTLARPSRRVRVKDLDEAKNWYVEKLDFRVVHEWPYADEKLAYIASRTTTHS
jgi:catechol-2,3-dioxygenase